LEHFGAQFVFPGAASAGEPFTAEIPNFTGCRKFRQFSERAGEDCLIAHPIMGWAKRPSDRVVDERRPRRPDFAHDVVSRSDHQRRYTLRFDYVRDETDGLVTEGSIGHEQC